MASIVCRRRRTTLRSGSSMRSARSPQLKQAINVLIGNKREFDTATNRDLYRAYVGGQAPERAVDLGVSEQLIVADGRAQQFLAAAIDDNRMQMRALDGVSAEAAIAAIRNG